jgi:hypothetical protein
MSHRHLPHSAPRRREGNGDSSNSRNGAGRRGTASIGLLIGAVLLGIGIAPLKKRAVLSIWQSTIRIAAEIVIKVDEDLVRRKLEHDK